MLQDDSHAKGKVSVRYLANTEPYLITFVGSLPGTYVIHCIGQISNVFLMYQQRYLPVVMPNVTYGADFPGKFVPKSSFVKT